MSEFIPVEQIESKIVVIHNMPVILDSDLAEFYGIETKQLKRAVRRHIQRFPSDFMIQLTKEEYNLLRRHFGTLKRGEHTKYLPYAFTENGVSMLSSVLNSEKAIQINIQIMRAFNRLKRMIFAYEELRQAIYTLAQKHDEDMKIVFMEFDRLERLLSPKKQIGFKPEGP